MRLLRRRLRGNAFLQRWRFGLWIALYAVASRLVRVREGRTLFLSDSRTDFSGNIAFLRDEIRRQRPDARIVGIFKAGLADRRPLRDSLRLPWELARAQTIVLDDYYPMIYPLHLRPETRLLQVWHAAGAYKKVGWSRAGLPGGPLPGSVAHRNYTDATVSSEAIRPDYAEAFAMDVARVHALGVPRTDVFFDTELIERSRRDVRARLGIRPDQRVAVFAPTFRGNGQLSAHYDIDAVPWSELPDDLGEEWVVLVKLHPFVARKGADIPSHERIIDVSAERELNELMMAADVLITDYSSAIFEFSLLGRPMVFFCPDVEVYAAERSFYHPFEDYLAGPLVTDGADLAAAIRDARAGDDLEAFRERFMSACDGHSTERIVREMILTPRQVDERPKLLDDPPVQPTRIDGPVGRHLLAAHVLRTALRACYAPLKLLPTRRKVVMISREHPEETDDFIDLRTAIAEMEPTVRVVSLVRMVPPGLVRKLGYAAHLLVQLFHVATARVLIVDTYSMVASMLRHKDDLVVIQIWHALGAFKKFGLSILGTGEGRDERLANAMRMHAGYDLVLASGDACREPYAEAFGTDDSRIVVAPLPRVDRLRDDELTRQTRERIYRRHPHLRGARIAVFAPTFRIEDTAMAAPDDVVAALEAVGVHVVVKLHPLMTLRGSDVDTAEGFSTQEMLTVADVFITDYSSTLFEAAVRGVPTYFLAPDLDEYLATRDFYLDYRRDLPGPVCTTVDELATAVEAGAAKATDAAAFARRWVAESEGTTARPCADRIARLVLDRIDGPGRAGALS
ncbi:CDP-glycerol glycerophosphotransferase family protein [Microbacterium sp. 77mftsu3.1]|uniref:CDP-glycerol glycerophosphotransferase family protein n=1 Tax=Microbacterium sp. 77mftsu3.1 TaxID=1761802 RepID=UPI00039AEF9D|nr:CDP-glycerol glycerophosphotransferase family protein [Microbacterium sp. 77mftsu3.1]SDG38124.1 CDP-glycerol glycerophosphotransferase, TagB/SpsB family [Microbacterium sp. 77mftsu3.1]